MSPEEIKKIQKYLSKVNTNPQEVNKLKAALPELIGIEIHGSMSLHLSANGSQMTANYAHQIIDAPEKNAPSVEVTDAMKEALLKLANAYEANQRLKAAQKKAHQQPLVFRDTSKPSNKETPEQLALRLLDSNPSLVLPNETQNSSFNFRLEKSENGDFNLTRQSVHAKQVGEKFEFEVKQLGAITQDQINALAELQKMGIGSANIKPARNDKTGELSNYLVFNDQTTRDRALKAIREIDSDVRSSTAFKDSIKVTGKLKELLETVGVEQVVVLAQLQKIGLESAKIQRGTNNETGETSNYMVFKDETSRDAALMSIKEIDPTVRAGGASKFN